MEIANQTYFYPFTSYSENNANSILIDGPHKVLIDPGHKHLWPGLKKKIMEDGINPADIKTVLYTHCHPDHMEAGQVLTADYGADQAMHPLENEFLNGPGWEFFPAMGFDYPPKDSINRLIPEGQLDLVDKTLEVYLTPGHTPGGICLYWPAQKILISGDLVFARGVGRTDFPGGSLEALRQSVIRMSQLDVDILLPGHGPAVIGTDKVKANFEGIMSVYF